jgi:tRNA-splicing ligase RtcB
VPIKAWVDGVELEPQAEQQLRNTAALSFVYRHLAVMPDCHWGMGATVGSVVATERAIIPAAVGVDIGCGMVARQLPGVKLEAVYQARKAIRGAIERSVPHGRTDRGGAKDRGAWSTSASPGSPRNTRASASGVTRSSISARSAQATTSSRSVATKRTGCG